MNTSEKWQKIEKENDVKGWITTIVIHLLILLAFILLAMKTPKDEPLQGVLIDFGNSTTGQGQVSDPGQTAAEPVESKEAVAEAVEASSEPQVKPTVPDEVVTQDVAEAPAITPQKEKPKPTKEEIKAAKEAAEAKKKAEAEAKAKAEADAIAKAKAAEEARKKAEAKALADDLNNAWGQGGSIGPTADPNDDFGGPDGIPNGGIDDGSGQGTSGNGPALSGLGGRKWVKLPQVKDDSQKFGTIILKIKVDKNGNIIGAEFAKGSTITDLVLIQRAKDALKNAKISSDPNAASEAIGYVTFNFRAQ